VVLTTLLDIAEQARTCTLCTLSDTRHSVVFGSGNSNADLLILGEAPGAAEDESGVPFVGRSGALLDRLCHEELGLSREQIYVANILKCRPPQNRNPRPAEIQACRPFLRQQLALIAPRVIIPLGNFATRFLLNTKQGITALRGSSYVMDTAGLHGPATVIPTFHPAAVLRGGKQKLAEIQEDFRRAGSVLEGVEA
jgi:uracil-DNA glycosylase